MSKFMYYCGKLWDLMCLNILVLVCSLPIITFGASFTSMHYVLRKIYRDENDSNTRIFFRAFKENFRQATMYELIFAAALYLFTNSWQIIRRSQGMFPNFLNILLPIVIIIVSCVCVWTFILQSRYRNTIWGNIRNAAGLILQYPFRSVLIAALTLLPAILLRLTLRTVPVVLLLGFTGAGLSQVRLYHGLFQKLEGSDEQECPEEE